MSEQEEIKLSTEEKGWLGKIRDSAYENWQTILVALVVLIVGISAYNYNSKTENNSSSTVIQQEGNGESQQNTVAESSANSNENNATDQEKAAEQKDQADAQKQDQTNVAPADNKEASGNTNPNNKTNTENKTQPENAIVASDDGYKVTTEKGEGLTHLARKALGKYLEENKDEQITVLHKIYIEDYLQKKLGSGRMEVGQAETFSKKTIQEAVDASKKLSQKSLDNLKKYEIAIK